MNHDIHVHYHYDNDLQGEDRLQCLERKLDLVLEKLETLMATMADLTAAVARNTDAEDAVIVLLKGIAQQLKDAQGDPEAIAAVIAQIDANTAKAAAAVVENTPSS